MLRELISIFRADNPLGRMGDNFQKMLGLAQKLTKQAGEIFLGSPATPEVRTQIYDQDVKINQLERKIRKQVIAHLSVGRNAADVPYSLLLMSLVKDVERIGDYAKNLAEVLDATGSNLPDDDNMAELREIGSGVQDAFRTVGQVFAKSDEEEAVGMIRQGRDISHRCDALINKIAKGDYDAAQTTTLVLGTRYYKRIGAHLVNILTGVVMPLHKLDYYDEKELVERD